MTDRPFYIKFSEEDIVFYVSEQSANAAVARRISNTKARLEQSIWMHSFNAYGPLVPDWQGPLLEKDHEGHQSTQGYYRSCREEIAELGHAEVKANPFYGRSL